MAYIICYNPYYTSTGYTVYFYKDQSSIQLYSYVDPDGRSDLRTVWEYHTSMSITGYVSWRNVGNIYYNIYHQVSTSTPSGRTGSRYYSGTTSNSTYTSTYFIKQA